jgi:cell division protein FtsN
VAVLAGSYTNRENAVVQAGELTDKGFAARIVETTVGGRRYYRVLVGEAGTQDEAMALMRKLKDAGFESVPLPLGGNG